jgi:transcriptional regulator GlxA family with amidase domain
MTLATTDVLMLMFDDMELLDFAGPYEVLTTATRVHARQQPAGTPALFRLHTVSRDGQAVRARAGLRLQADHALDAAPASPWLIVPGGVVDAVLDDPATLQWVARQAAAGSLTASVCTGAFVLAAAGVLKNAAATTHWEDAADLQRRHPDLRVQPDRRWVDNGAVVTSAGIAAGIDMCLYLVARHAGTTWAQATARQMDCPWPADHA